MLHESLQDLLALLLESLLFALPIIANIMNEWVLLCMLVSLLCPASFYQPWDLMELVPLFAVLEVQGRISLLAHDLVDPLN
jgi:hypothetical protein